MKKKFLPIAVFVVCAASIGGGWYGRRQQIGVAEASTQAASSPSSATVLRNFNEAQDVVNRHYVDEVPSDTLAKAAIQGMLRSLDPHSNYFDSKEFQELQSEQRSRFFGIGVSIQRRDDRVYVLGTIENTPADRSGLRYGDAIVAVNGRSTVDWTTSQVSDQVRGPQGEFVEVTVERVGVPKPLTFKIARDAVPQPSIRHYFMIRPGVGYVALLGGFTHTTEDELREALQFLQSKGMKSLILDLRGNPGGLLNQAVNVASAFLPKDVKVLSQKGRVDLGDGDSREYTSNNRKPDESALIVLINSGSASASEIVAGAIQDHDRGLIVGEPSFGKGLVQTVFRLPFGSGLALTTAKYYTPSGRCIQRSYSTGSLYEYYSHQSAVKPVGEALSTDTGRKVYAGGGITPDIEVKEQSLTPAQGVLFNAGFMFSRQLIGGQLPGLSAFRVTQSRYHHVLQDDEYVVNDKVMAAFRNFLKTSDRYQVTDAQLTENADFVKNVIREHVVTAAFGTEAGMEIRLQVDSQLLKSLESLAAARDLANQAQLLRPSSSSDQ